MSQLLDRPGSLPLIAAGLARFKLHLRDLFWLIVVVALGCCWWMDHSAQRTLLQVERRKLDREYEELEARRLVDELVKAQQEVRTGASETRLSQQRIRELLEQTSQ